MLDPKVPGLGTTDPFVAKDTNTLIKTLPCRDLLPGPVSRAVVHDD
jgi:hypothetical protein